MRFDWTVQTVGYFSDPKAFDHVGIHYLHISYPKMAVEVQTQVTQVDLVTLVSQVGGGLGLFLGFSIMDYLLGIFKFILKLK